MNSTLLLDINPLDLFAALWFLFWWVGYTLYAAYQVDRKPCLAGELNHYRYEWMSRMLARDNRMTDSTSISNLERYVTFFASSTMLILAGLVTVMASTEQAIHVLRDLPFVGSSTQAEWEAKLLMLVAIFVYAFFKFSWSARQYGFCSVLIASAPMPTEPVDDSAREQFARGGAKVLSLAGLEFNKGLRAYYFGLSVLGWFLHASFFMLATIAVVVVLYRREFHSETLHSLLEAHGKKP